MRKPRILQKGAIYHVTSKINKGANDLKPAEVKYLFMETLKRARKKFKFSIKNFVIMDNHIHLIVEPFGSESLSRIMQWVLSVSAMQYNRIYKSEGHLWRARFWSKIVDDIKQLFDTFRYVSENPVKAEMIKQAFDYKFGGLYYILKGIFEIVDPPEFDYF